MLREFQDEIKRLKQLLAVRRSMHACMHAYAHADA
jgi:hypothetical protein